ncbi:tetratricopeptide repeat protein [Desulfosarcina sp.]|uniref:tetratricopeptide repeat protein n=1 Tax=Desulfosarcina sp. TaxID=2027861 RepID=UPI0029A7386F|nr:tetratricopeptide repeat protein [Desulfosarcina sp.]MDX2451208.1 tetratricopeptide repeat protein [Desulfosarcina sp.]MDX2489038.1 tetratricopeptide repeat protein [Desulfosarcina sp.]
MWKGKRRVPFPCKIASQTPLIPRSSAAGRFIADATIRFTRGRLMMKNGNYAEAMSLFQHALELDRQAGFTRGMADDLSAIAVIHEQLGEDEAALDCLDRSIKIYALLENLGRLESLAQKTGTDVRVTVHFINQWLAGEAVDAICR